MVESTKLKKIIFILGSTASGKSEFAVRMAEKFGGSLINCDSVQFYKNLEIGSASPSKEDKKRVPHYLYSYVEYPFEMTAGYFVDEFYRLIDERKDSLRFPLFIVGGTGFYIQALEKGLFDIQKIPLNVRIEIEKELLTEGADKLHSELIKFDPQTKIHKNDHYRLVRALEIIRYTGKAPSVLHAEQVLKNKKLPYPHIKMGFDLEKNILQSRVETRTQQMIQAGLIDEVAMALKCNQRNWAPLASVGYRETVQYLDEKKSLVWLEKEIVQSTMQLIKKQKTWFKRDSSTLWSNHQAKLEQFLNED